MKNPFIKLLSILIISFISFWFMSSFMEIKVFGVELNKIDFGISEQVMEDVAPTTETAVTVAPTKPMVKPQNNPNKEYKKFLYIGDSMLEWSCKRLGAYTDCSGAELYTVIWYASSTKKWGESKRLSQYIAQIQPDFIIICLGGNELFVRNIEKERTKYVKSMIAEMGEIPFVWIGPPNWKEDTGINKMIEKQVGSDRFFLSANLHFDRAKDGMHPTKKSAWEWMDKVVKWMNDNSICKLDTPTVKTKNPTKTFVLTPND